MSLGPRSLLPALLGIAISFPACSSSQAVGSADPSDTPSGSGGTGAGMSVTLPGGAGGRQAGGHGGASIWELNCGNSVSEMT